MLTSKNFRQMMTARPKELFFNDVQSRVLQLMPKTLVCEWGRGTGKGVVEAGRILYAVQHMPGSCLGMVAPSVKRCQTNILPLLWYTWRSGVTSVTSTTSLAKNRGRRCIGRNHISSP